MKINLFLWTIILVNRPLPMTCQMVPNLQCSKKLCHLWRWLIIKCYELNDEFTTIKQIICSILSSTTNTLKMWFTYLNVILISQNSRKSNFTKYFHLHNCTTLSHPCRPLTSIITDSNTSAIQKQRKNDYGFKKFRQRIIF